MISAVIVSGWIALIGLTGNADAIIGGGYAADGQFPYVVAITDIEQSSLCGGAIVSESHVLTAAHCVHNIEKKSYVIIAGVINLQNVDDLNKYKIEKIHVHPAFTPQKIIPVPDSPGEYTLEKEAQHDVAIVRVSRPFVFSEKVDSVWIADVFPKSHKYCSFAGWGITDDRMEVSDELMFTDMAIRHPDECCRIKCPHERGKLCVYNRRLSSTTCSGDSGGPLVCEGRAIGIASSSNCDPKEAAGFVNIIEYLPFITSILSRSSTGRRRIDCRSKCSISRLTRSVYPVL